MSIQYKLSENIPSRDTVLAVGTFDGVHQGHQTLFKFLKEEAESRNLLSNVVTFRNNPREILIPAINLNYISSLEDRIELIRSQQIDLITVLDFTRQLSCVKARDFCRLLVRDLRMKGLVVGPDFALGHNREGDIKTLEGIGEEMGFSIKVIDPKLYGEQPIRSRLLRKIISEGEVETACKMLGRPFKLCGVVSKGAGRGRSLGFPTANLDIESQLLVPGDGVYATWITVNGQKHKSATGIGTRPTFDSGQRSIESYIMDFKCDIYDATVSLEFVARIRDELYFEQHEDLIRQMKNDVERATVILDGNAGCSHVGS